MMMMMNDEKFRDGDGVDFSEANNNHNCSEDGGDDNRL